MKLPFDSKALKGWFRSEKRDLPWRLNPTPYAVWVSEVMLQQTQVTVVIPYFERWMCRFPSVKKLAESPLDDVIEQWEGLGYYSRARNLHEGAKYVLEHHQGALPSTQKELEKIKGLGPYTVGAILSFAFHQKVPAVDGNVIRVLSRLFNVKDDIAKLKTVRQLRELASEILPDKEPWIVSEALIELGATVCTKKPKCGECPLQSFCEAYTQGVAETLPYKSTKIRIVPLYRAVAVVTYEDKLLIQRGKKGEIMSDLHEFPYFEISASGMSVTELHQQVQDRFQLEVEHFGSLPEVSHSFTRYRVRLSPALFKCLHHRVIPEYDWVPFSKVKELAFSSGHRRILKEVGRHFV